MPVWAWAVLLLSSILLASFHANYKLAQKLQPTLRSSVIRLFEKRRMEGFHIRKQKAPGWQAEGEHWYKAVLRDLSLIKGPDFSKLFALAVGRKPNVKNGNETNWHKTIDAACNDLEALQAAIKDEEIIRSDDLNEHLAKMLVA